MWKTILLLAITVVIVVKSQILVNKPNKDYQACLTPSGGAGHCKHFQHCMQPQFKTNVWQIFEHICVIEKFSIGVCCPEEVAGRVGPAFSSNLPVGGDEAPIWGIADVSEVNETAKIVNRPEERGCGLATKVFPKVTGGRPADPGEWPWMAAIMVNGQDGSLCGGVLITDRHVLTAAHCFGSYHAVELIVRLGEYDFTRRNDTRSRDFRVKDIILHEDFDKTTYLNDIAIIKLHAPTVFNSYVWPICMPPTDETWEGYSAVITGWGTQFFGGPSSDVLMEVIVPIWSQRRCELAFTQRIKNVFICAGSFDGGRDSCQGDSGGPLMIQLPNKRWVTVGIVSWGVRCGEPNHPGIYTRVSEYTQWIIDNSKF